MEKVKMTGYNNKRASLIVLLFSVVFNAAGQVLWKTARLVQPDASLLELFLPYQTWAGFVFYGLSALCWLWVLSRAQLSFAYPILALSYPIVVGLSALFFAEAVSTLRWVGVGVIVFGVSLLAKT